MVHEKYINHIANAGNGKSRAMSNYRDFSSESIEEFRGATGMELSRENLDINLKVLAASYKST